MIVWRFVIVRQIEPFEIQRLHFEDRLSFTKVQDFGVLLLGLRAVFFEESGIS